MSPSLPVAPAAGLNSVQSESTTAAQLPFDPRRLLGGVRSRWRWVAVAALAGALLGLGIGMMRSSTRYEVAVRLIKREVPGSFRAGEIGEAFKPRAMNNATLIGAALSDNVLARVAAKAQPSVPLSLLRLSVDAKEQRGTDFVALTISGYTSPEATVALANLWGQEIVAFSRELQTRESREVRIYLQQQVESIDADLSRVNHDILELSRREGLVNADKQIDAYLRSLSDLDLRYQTARIDLQTTKSRLRNVDGELSRLSPLRDKLAAVQHDLDEALNKFAEQNPIVIELRERVAKLKAEIAGQKPKDFDPASAATSTLGSALFLQSLELKAHCEGLGQQIAELEQLRIDTRKELEAVPEKSAQLSRLLRTHASLDTARGMLFARLREAQLFEEKAPGYFQLFSPAGLDSVDVRPRWLKLVVFGALGLIAGIGGGIAAGAGFELVDSRLRTAAEAARIYRAPTWSVCTAGATPDKWKAAIEELWMQWMPHRTQPSLPLAVWSPMPTAEEEQFWTALVAEARRLLGSMLIVDAGDTPCAHLVNLQSGEPEISPGISVLRLDPISTPPSEVQRLVTQLLESGDGRLVCVRFAGAVREPVTTLARACAPALVLVTADSARLDFWEEHARVLRTATQPPAGLLVAGQARLLAAK